MRIDPDTCTACHECVAYCPVGAIHGRDGEPSVIDLDACVECGVCLRSAPCPTSSIVTSPLEWPRSLRAAFSDPLTEHPATSVPGRGTEEMKTNDVTHRYTAGFLGLNLELGRPGAGTSFREVEKVTRTLAAHGVRFEEANPLTGLMADRSNGSLLPAVLDERVLSVVVECIIEEVRLVSLLRVLRAVADRLVTAVSVGVTVPPGRDPRIVAAALAAAGHRAAANGKTNVGLAGRS